MRPGDRLDSRPASSRGRCSPTLFQLVGGRLLGPELFAPVSVLWTLMFLTGTVGLTPVEQFVAREATAVGACSRRSSAIVASSRAHGARGRHVHGR
jgi:hypothetical protein